MTAQLKTIDGGKSKRPPDGGDVELRVAVLEARMESLATKADVSEAKSSIVQWVVGTGIALGVAGITVMTFVLNNAIPKPLAAVIPPPSPVVVNVQAPAPPAASAAAPAASQKP